MLHSSKVTINDIFFITSLCIMYYVIVSKDMLVPSHESSLFCLEI